ncbi:MAG: ComF family protein [Deltaproteobacteria bacterium]|nr:ComF family protein [Deltaproteobacteria bacterium]
MPLDFLFDSLLNAMTRPTCASCDVELRRAAVFCAPCAEAFVPAEPCSLGGLDVHAAGLYGGPLARAIQRLKFGDRPDLARPLGELLRRLVLERRLDADVLVPVPVPSSRLVERGYNQATLLVRRLAASTPARVEARVLSRLDSGARQVELGRAERLKNAAISFVVEGAERVRGRRILLVDDVVTTGATAHGCARALWSVGASRVTVLALARTP